MPAADETSASSSSVDIATTDKHPERRRLVLCFDGTGNKYQGDESDTNIVKIYQMLEKHTPGQYHYYQPGIGTYSKDAGATSGYFHFWSSMRQSIWGAFDEAVGASFIDHVIAGYQFVMRYYQKHDDIYIFGFSRGAYTARFLAEMIHHIGLLSKGNEEMVHFAYETFSKWQQSAGNDPKSKEDLAVENYMNSFKDTFARPHVSIHFLGLFDCVNSVGQFEIPLYRTSYKYIAQPAAKHIRHAVSIHERRLKFKPALFLFDDKTRADIDLKEVWFAGNHGDVGGGWPLEKGQTHLLSDTPLNWMVQESLNLPQSKSTLSYATTNVKTRDREENQFPEPNIVPGSSAWNLRRDTSKPHDMLKYGHGVGLIAWLGWWLLEILPFFTRLELESGKWVPRRFPPNLGADRDIPSDAVIHPSVTEMVQAGILDKEPHKGGDNSNLPNVDGFKNAFNAVRKKTAAKSGDQKPLLSNGTEPHWADSHDGAVKPMDFSSSN